MPRSIRTRIALAYALLMVLALVPLTIYVRGLVRDVHVDRLTEQLLSQAYIVGHELLGDGGTLSGAVSEDVDGAVESYAGLLDSRVSVIALDGTVLADSNGNPATMESHADRPEVLDALTNGQGSSIRYSRTMGYEMLYVAILLEHGGEPVGIVRTSMTVADVNAEAQRATRGVLGAGLVALGVGVVISQFMAERIARPVRQLTEAAAEMAKGNLGARAARVENGEIGDLARAFNHMASLLQVQITRLAAESGRLSAVLERMADGVLIVDEHGSVTLLNVAAAAILGTSEQEALHRSFAQIVRQHQIIDLWADSQQSREEREEIIELARHGTYLRAIVTPLGEGEGSSSLVMLQDLTEVRRAEKVRRDFISNASHQLRTPLASLKALVDTLRDGALDDPPAARRFLDRVETEVDALTQMVQELLELSRIEASREPLHREAVSVDALLDRPVERLRPQAERAGLDLIRQVPDQVPVVLADAERVGQVVTNLVHNAIKFTPPGGRITVTANASAESVVVAVEDTGVGIPPDELSRIFERFYKADSTRRGGGTGLGLAIAKHIVESHGGRIWAESVEGRGSTFFFTLPSVQRKDATP